MNDRQEDKLNMINRTLSVCKVHNDVWSTNVFFTRNLNNVQASVDIIGELRETQTTGMEGLLTDRERIKQDLAYFALGIAGAVMGYADENDDEALLKKVDFGFSDLFYDRNVITISRCNTIFKTAKNMLTDLTDEGITAGDITTLKDKLKAFDDILDKINHLPEDKQTATKLLPEEFDKIERFLARLDRFMLRFRDNKHFYETYFNAREIYDRRGRRVLSPSGQDLPEEEPLT